MVTITFYKKVLQIFFFTQLIEMNENQINLSRRQQPTKKRVVLFVLFWGLLKMDLFFIYKSPIFCSHFWRKIGIINLLFLTFVTRIFHFVF